MSARTVTVQTGDHGPVTTLEPAWCVTGHTEPVGYRADVQHTGRPLYVHLPVPGGVVELLEVVRVHRPFSDRPGGDRPYVGVTLGEAQVWETTVPGVLLLAARLVLAALRAAVVALRLDLHRTGGGER